MTLTSNFDFLKYLREQAHRYYPDNKVEAREVQETIILTIYNEEWTCVIGSDDDYYSFTSPRGSIITIPLYQSSPFDKLTPEQQSWLIDIIEEDVRDCSWDYAKWEAETLDEQAIKDYMELWEDMKNDGG